MSQIPNTGLFLKLVWLFRNEIAQADAFTLREAPDALPYVDPYPLEPLSQVM